MARLYQLLADVPAPIWLGVAAVAFYLLRECCDRVERAEERSRGFEVERFSAAPGKRISERERRGVTKGRVSKFSGGRRP